MRLDDLAAAAASFVGESPLNRVPDLGGLQIFDPPLVGAAAADDPLFATLKTPEAIGPHHLSPTEWLPGARTVVSYFLPFTATVRQANRRPACLLPNGSTAGSKAKCSTTPSVVSWLNC
jgi:hypothetical protein